MNFCPIYFVTGKVTILFFKRDRQFLDLATVWTSPVVRGYIVAVLFGIPMNSSRGIGWQDENTDYNYQNNSVHFFPLLI